ncbi:MAG: PAS domain-containing protein [bacterium]
MNSALHQIIDSAMKEPPNSGLKAAGFREETSAVYVLDRDGAIIDTNEALIGLTGMPVEELTGRHLADFLDGPARQALRTMIRDEDPSGLHAFEGALINSRGEKLAIRAMVHPLFDEKAKAMGFVVHVQEKRPDANQENPEPRLSRDNLFSLISDAVIECDGNLRVTYLNHSGMRLFGCDGKDKITGRSVLDLIHPDDRKEALRTMEDCVAERVGCRFSARLLRGEGPSFPAELRLCPAAWEDEEKMLRLVVKDLSVKREAERFRKLFQTFIGLKPEGVVLVRGDGRIELANQHMANLLGYPGPDHLHGVNINRLVQSRILKVLTGPEKEKLESVSLQMVRARAVNKEGKKFQVALTGLVITDEHGEPDGLVCSVSEAKENHSPSEGQKNNSVKERNHG